jgi:predicted dehydrogenase
MKPIKRRQFIETASKSAGLMIVAPHVLGGPRHIAPSDQLNIACIGVGTQGTRVMLELLKLPELVITSVCDPVKEDTRYLNWGQHELRNGIRHAIEEPTWDEGTEGCRAGREPAKRIVEKWYSKQKDRKGYKGCKTYADYRELLEKETGLDGVVVGAVDHQHAIISLKAMEKGKHVFCQKPLTNSIYEARLLGDAAKKYKVATQVATGTSSQEDTDLLCELIWSGAIGPIREVHNWSHRPVWPSGMTSLPDPEPVPEGFDWDLWLGPAQMRPFSYKYTHTVFRGWYDFGTGAIGDMGCYSFDVLYRVLKLGAPTSVEASANTYFFFPNGNPSRVYSDSVGAHPAAMTAHFEFPAREGFPALDLYWYDGGMKPPKPKELDLDGIEMPAEGMLFVGEKGKILGEFTGENAKLIPSSAHKAFTIPPKTIERSKGHYQDWINACKGGKAARATFDFAAPVTESLNLANLAMRTRKKLTWDATAMKTNSEEANRFLKPEYRKGWEI